MLFEKRRELIGQFATKNKIISTSNKFTDTPKKIDKSSPKEPQIISFVPNKSVKGTAKIYVHSINGSIQ